jgi:hypothetical protein
MSKKIIDFAVMLLLVLLFGAIAGQAYTYLFTSSWKVESSEPFYGNWLVVFASILLLSLFFLAFLRPFEKRDWRQLGIAEAYFVALFTEMFGVPLTIYLLTSVFGYNIGLSGFEGHLWAVLLARLGLLGLPEAVALVMMASTILIVFGIALMALGWRAVYYSKGLVSTGIYSRVRHPQYTGFLLVIIGFLVQWPTVITLLMFPGIVYMYYRLAKREEIEMVEKFGKAYQEYMARSAMFFPRLRIRV